jgi:hypothetical protein
MPIPLPWRPDWLRTSSRAAGINSSTDFGFLKYDGHRGAGYFSPLAPIWATGLSESAAAPPLLLAAGLGLLRLQPTAAAATAQTPNVKSRMVDACFGISCSLRLV